MSEFANENIIEQLGFDFDACLEAIIYCWV